MTSNEPIEVTAEVIEPTDALEVVYTPAVLTDNLAALEAHVMKEIEPYVGAQIDPTNNEMVKEARKCLADLNKIKEPIEKERKRVKKEYEAPLKAFESRVKEITSKIDEARNQLKVQVDEADAMFKQMRRDYLYEEYVGVAGILADVIQFDAILDDKWLTRSCLESKALNELDDKVEQALKGYNTLQTKELNHKDEVVKHYAETLDLISSLELEDKLNAKDKEMEEFKAAQAALEAAKQAPEPEPIEEPTELIEELLAPLEEPVYKWHLDMDFIGTHSLAIKASEALRSLGITGATIKCEGEVND